MEQGRGAGAANAIGGLDFNLATLVLEQERLAGENRLLKQDVAHQYGALNGKLETTLSELRTANDHAAANNRLLIAMEHKSTALERIFAEVKDRHKEDGGEVGNLKLAFAELKGAAKMAAFLIVLSVGGYGWYATSQFNSLHDADVKMDKRIDGIPGAPR